MLSIHVKAIRRPITTGVRTSAHLNRPTAQTVAHRTWKLECYRHNRRAEPGRVTPVTAAAYILRWSHPAPLECHDGRWCLPSLGLVSLDGSGLWPLRSRPFSDSLHSSRSSAAGRTDLSRRQNTSSGA